MMPSNRSLLFVPGNRPERFDKAAASGADALLFDLEDAVPEAQRESAALEVTRWLQAHARPGNGSGGLQRWLRVPDARNRPAWLMPLLAQPGLDGLVLPKVEAADHLNGWSLPVIAQIESALGVLAIEAIASADSTLQGLAIGPEDLSVSLRVAPEEPALAPICARAVVAARAYGRDVYACPGSIAEFRDLDRWRGILLAGRALGSDGMMCIHPAQVAVANEVFSPDSAAIERARAVLAVWDEAVARGLAAASLDGRMIDPPVANRARDVIEAARRFGLIDRPG